MDKEDVICIYVYTQHNGLFLSHKKEWNLAICHSMDGSGGSYASDINQTEKASMVWFLLCVESKNKINNKKQKRNKQVVARGCEYMGVEMGSVKGIKGHKLTVIKQ